MDVNKLCMGCMEDDSGDPICPKCGRPADLVPKNSLQLKPRTLLRDQYVIGRALGHGGFGITYLAWDVGLEARLAIKEYMPNGVAGRSTGDTRVLAFSDQTKVEFDYGLERFLEEARVLKKFRDHPGIVSIDTIFRENGTAYLVMEYLDGMTFEEFLKRRGGKVTVETALRVILPVTDALAAVHAEGILHRDISPDNIHLARNGKVKLIDFGAARNALGQKSRNLSIILKEGYAPEEQYRASGIQGPWTDVYATAATMYHAITGQVPQPSLDRQADDQLQAPSKMGVIIDPNIEAALLKALSVKAADRFPSMEDLNLALSGNAGAVAATRKVDRNDPRVRELEQAAMGQMGGPPPVFPAGPRSQSGPVTPAPPPPPFGPPALPSPVFHGGQLPPPPPAAMAMSHSSPRPRWMWPAALGAVAVLAVVAAVVYRPISDDHNDNKDKKTVSDDQQKQPEKQQQKQQDQQQQQQDQRNQQDQQDQQKQQDRQKQQQDQRQQQDQGKQQQQKQPDRQKQQQQEQQQQQQQDQQQQQGQKQQQQDQQQQKQQADNRSDNGDNGNRNQPPAESYEGLVQAAVQASQRNIYQQAEQLLSRAISLDPNRPQAYDKLGELELYFLNQVSPAIQNYQASIAHGGQATFHVAHDHSTGNFTTNCKGYLYVSKALVHYKAFDSVHEFSAPRAQVREFKRNRFTINLSQRAAVDLKAFHIKLADGRNYNLAPLSHFQEAERDLILSIGGNE